MEKFAEGTKVSWNWGVHKAHGKIVQSFVADVERTIKGQSVKRKASREEPAYLIEQEDGDRVLKSHSELERGQ